ncbi:FAD/NAD(P)-binding protein [Sphingomonas sp. NFR15]|uniref:FAD/NAD(P)-binding protein n=1 Tax=Sphingomonas sp. NFR15 TaxID=1566282 RepID=UPI00088C0DDC|nr:FAD/NAD(P)-binding protein [Sphingomonas sp. NFR15]SDA29684.1 Uncharacterized NAD(P)/FAD-binding protein YdhS [Sphingomonas sp. NFR15]
MAKSIAIIGGGFSGTLAAINLLRHCESRLVLIERQPLAGEGLAYGAAHPAHLLNVRAANMSAFPDDPGQFHRWVAAQAPGGDPNPFVPRLRYGDYLRELLDAARHAAEGRLEIIRGDAVDVIRDGGTTHVVLDDGRRIDVDTAMLAIGNLPPHTQPGTAGLPERVYAPDPWAPGALDGLGEDDTVLALGTGLTMVDVVLALRARGFGGRIVAMSRRGLLPHPHAAAAPPPDPLDERPRETGSALLRRVRARARAIGWRAAIDELRRFTQDMWRAASDHERARFLRHLRPWWDVHRHRLAPAVAEALADLRESGTLSVVAGKIVATAADDDGLTVTWRPRASAAPETVRVARMINCTGPQGDLLRAEEPLLRNLVARGTLRPDALRIGIDVDAQSRTIAADGTSNAWLYALGPMTRGAFWEIVAVPDIRVQSWSVARRLANAQWVGGEGL